MTPPSEPATALGGLMWQFHTYTHMHIPHSGSQMQQTRATVLTVSTLLRSEIQKPTYVHTHSDMWHSATWDRVIKPSLCLSICLSVCLSVCLSTCLLFLPNVVLLLCVAEQALSAWLILSLSAGQLRYRNQTKSHTKLSSVHALTVHFRMCWGVQGCAGVCRGVQVVRANHFAPKQITVKHLTLLCFSGANTDAWETWVPSVLCFSTHT